MPHGVSKKRVIKHEEKLSITNHWKWKSLSCVRLFATSGTVVHGILQARILEWVAVLFSRHLPHPGIKPGSPALQADYLPSQPPGKPDHQSLGKCNSKPQWDITLHPLTMTIIQKAQKIIKSWESESVHHSVVPDFVAPWVVARQVPLSMGLPRQEYWSGLPFPSPEDLPNSGIEPGSPTWQVDSLPPGKPRVGKDVEKLKPLLMGT